MFSYFGTFTSAEILQIEIYQILWSRGLVQVQDMDGLGAHHISLFNITTIKKLVKVSHIGDSCTGSWLS